MRGRNILCLTTLLVLLFQAPAFAGELFDDYLNYVRPGIDTGVGDTSTKAPCGQSITLPENTGEIYRIGVRPDYDTWNEGESVTLTLYDSSAKSKALASHTVPYEISRVQPFKWGKGSHFSTTNDYLRYFHLRAKVSDTSPYYFELTVSGGDGQVSFSSFSETNEIQGLSYRVDIKPVADREANLEKYFSERVNLDHPDLAEVKKAVEAKDWDAAISALSNHFHNRKGLWDSYEMFWKPSPDPNNDYPTADLLLTDRIWVRGLKDKDLPMDKKTVPFTAESYWAALLPTAENPVHGFDPSVYSWHIGRELGAAYTGTAEEKYARKAIDLRMRFVLDNPCPRRVFPAETDFKWQWELWNDRTAAARAPGHATLVYARLYNYPGWTDDERLVLFSFFEDNAYWCSKSTADDNWLAEAAKTCMDFGISWPEWKLAKKYKSFGATTLATINARGTIQADGVSKEAAIKYHGMVARRLWDLYESYLKGEVEIEKENRDYLVDQLGKAYEHMAYTLQPDGFVVMYGDSWYESYVNAKTPDNPRSPAPECELDYKGSELYNVAKGLGRDDLLWIASRGAEGKSPDKTSNVFAETGYFIMRSDFDKGDDFIDATQLFIHNGNWTGSHAHRDYTAINLYSHGRTLLVDPGMYTHNPPPGVGSYHHSKVHSMLTIDDNDAGGKDAGDSEWTSNMALDYYDGFHIGYNGWGAIDGVNRKVAYIKGHNYFLVDDSINKSGDIDSWKWKQNWDMTDAHARVDKAGRYAYTTFDEGGNLLIAQFANRTYSIEEMPGITATERYDKTNIVKFVEATDDPRYTTLLYPKDGMFSQKDISAIFQKSEMILPDKQTANKSYSIKITVPDGTDWNVFGSAGEELTFRNGSHVVRADFATVNFRPDASVKTFAWSNGRLFHFAGKTWAQSANSVHSLAARYDGDTLTVEASEPTATLAIRAGDATTFIVNGKKQSSPKIENGMFYPFPDAVGIVADDATSFVRITETDEWEYKPMPDAYSGGYTQHETDPGRHESGDFILQVPETKTYTVQVHMPDVMRDVSTSITYTIKAMGKPAEVTGAIINVAEKGDNTWEITADHSEKIGWVDLGDFALPEGEVRVNAKNTTEIDGQYFAADAIRLVPFN